MTVAAGRSDRSDLLTTGGRVYVYVFAFLLVVLGAASSILTKALYDHQAPARDGVNEPFRKPWFVTTGECCW